MPIIVRNFNKLSTFDIQRFLFHVENTHLKKSDNQRVCLLNRYLKLSRKARKIAAYGIERHKHYCDALNIGYDVLALGEIMTDAKDNKSIALENERDIAEARKHPKYTGYKFLMDLLVKNNGGRNYKKMAQS